ncbi:rhodanese-like domain-containing protein [Sulfuricurvum sp. RIFCSPLOWO2_12_FULL_43_24]|uniref:rhodanese-like domain-containing protein n=1 Tax=Sulfuricurvum sp. RIFCSPLOWO2_12_FULL_43_24 TaxID=1802247 RepID=UPI0008B73548|nr:rhodanese-like domain-containing protein [Sulfuricurvum sp. RIFCSPLOWO2_12_FULL_43_24]OHD85893.1 MAG: sulfurtransferase [Sulfuricurvum sp. RIFCSPLOWO2_02_43_6]OHD89736.1 MAG: sulfurtransferase [Sulfuricurvum sp. RIFCSPLOWO2_12_FULL_43_24]
MKRRMVLMVASLLMSSSLMAGQAESEKLISAAKAEAGEMAPKQLKEMLDAEKKVIVMDVREENQRAEGEIYAPSTMAITRGNLEFEVLNKIKDKNALIVTYCRGGSRGALAAQTLKKLGFVNATNLKGGLKGWAEEGYPIETGLGVTLLTKEQ